MDLNALLICDQCSGVFHKPADLDLHNLKIIHKSCAHGVLIGSNAV